MQTDLSKFNNDWFVSGNPVKRVVWYIVNTIFFNSYWFPFYGLKRGLLRIFGASVGNGVLIKPAVNIKYPWKLIIGNNVWVGEKVWIDSLAQVTIGNNVCISQGAFILTGNHNYKEIFFDLVVQPVTIEDGVWIGAKAVVCPGITCFSHAILTVGSVATKDLDAYYIYQGNPAEKIKERRFSAADL